MSEDSILIIDDEVNFLLSKAILEPEGFTAIFRAKDCASGLRVALEMQPSLVLMNEMEFRADGREFVEKLKEEQLLTRVVVCNTFSTPVKKFIEAGIHDYITRPTDEIKLVDTVKKALAFDTNPQSVSKPIVEKLLQNIEWQRQEYIQLKERYNWYKGNVNRNACDCQELIETEKYTEPKSTDLRRLGSVDFAFSHGSYYQCQICGTQWINWEESAFGGKPWELATEYDDLIQTGDIDFSEATHT
ncbi:MAG: response regulator [Deltaproteobacteria bacterium]|nr:response regulator [Deltaproteobacteria bacterium]